MQTPPSVSTLLESLETFAAGISRSLPAAVDWQWRPAPAEWSLAEVMCHLRDVEREVHQPRFHAVLQEEMPFIAGVSSNEWAGARGYRKQDGPQARDAFLAARAETLSLLRTLDESDWQRAGSHSFFGMTTMHELLNLVTKHDNVHRQQIAMLLEHRS